MELLSIKKLDLAGKKVFIRCDFNVPMDEFGNISDDRRIRSALSTINFCLDQECAVILASHLGRPEGKVNMEYSLMPVARRLQQLLKRDVQLSADVVGEDAMARAASLKSREVLLLENLRFEAGETKDDETLSQKLASMAEFYINDAFGVSHRAHSSVHGITKYFDEAHRSAGFLLEKEISNLNRSFGARISGEIAKRYGNEGLPENTITLNMKGVAGQSLGAFMSKGININLYGAANDYIGKGMNGGSIVITAEKSGQEFALGGNTCLYGATGGRLYINGQVGERFAVRNSGAITIVEGTGDHPCEYMTGGTVVILGKTGDNFGAGMTGGKAFVYDEDRTFYEKINIELVEAIRLDNDEFDADMFELKNLLKDFVAKTGSQKAQDILHSFRSEVRKIWMIIPRGARPTLEASKRGE